MERIYKMLLLASFLELRCRYDMERPKKSKNKIFEISQELKPESSMGASGPF